MLNVVLPTRFRMVSAVQAALLGVAAFILFVPPVAPVRAGGDAFFIEKVAPILAQRCLSCHHGDKAKGGLDLSTRKGLRAGGDKGPVIVAGKAVESRLPKMVSGKKPAMPKGAEQPLSASEVASLKAWIDAGADWPAKIVLKAERPKPSLDWWSIKPVVRPDVPKLKNADGVRNPIDSFIRARLETEALDPSKEAGRLTLIRRLTFDLHGLPPTPEEVDAFLKDQDAAAYDKLVDRLLASPRYGERWGRHWLDVVHYGDTHGYDRDKRRPYGWPYRDYVIRSLNADKPYSRFVREQLAGDVLYPKDKDGVTATGFIAAGPWDFEAHTELREGSIDQKKTVLADRDDMLTNAMSTFTSLTVHCARCHDHKFDPIPQGPLYIAANIPTASLQNNLATKTNLAVFFCPSDSAASNSPSPNTANNGITSAPVALSNYKGVSGSNFCWGPYPNVGPSGSCDCFYANGVGHGDGMFFRTDIIFKVTLVQITDGTSNTFMIGEDIPSLDCWCAWPYANTAVGTCNFPPNLNLDGLFGGPCTAAAVAADSAWDHTFGFRSRHPGGLQFAYADGAVHFIQQTIDMPTYRAMSTIQGAESLQVE